MDEADVKSEQFGQERGAQVAIPIVIRFATVISTPLLSLHLDQPTLSQKSNNQFGRLCWVRKSVDGCVHRGQMWSDQSIGKGCASHGICEE